MNEPGSEKILGVDREILEKFLVLIRDKFQIATNSNYYLERIGTSGINIAITNQRDFVTHLITLLKNLDLSKDEQLGQYYNAEEHMRRAIIEPIQTAMDIKKSEIVNILPTYSKLVVPMQKKASFTSAPKITAVIAEFDHVAGLLEKARNAKAENMWTQTWEDGYRSCIEGVDRLKKLHEDLETYIVRAKDNWRFVITILIALGVFAAGVVVTRLLL